MLVTRILGDCPNCGGKGRFGNVSIQREQVLRGCMNCKYHTFVPLPKIRKKIIYLDQFFFSNAFREGDARFVEAAKRIRDISALQLLVAPFSSVHEDETHQWRGYGGKKMEDLMEFIKATSRGHEFYPAYDIEEAQIVQGFQNYLAGNPPVFDLEECEAVDADIHNWDDYFRIDVGRYLGDIELIRDLKRQSVEGLVDIFPAWRQSQNSFEQDFEVELRGAAKGYLESYVQYACRIAAGDYAALFEAPIMSMVVQALLHCLPGDVAPEDALKRVGDFFKSPHFAQIPYQWLSARMYATLKEMVKGGAYMDRESAVKRLNGFFGDVKHIATYAPYCDAFVMDKAMAALVASPHVALEKTYGVRIFSLNNWEDFLDWLNQVALDMSEEHRAGLAAAYP